MASYKKFRVKACADHTLFKVEVKGFLGWKSGFVHTSYFAMDYPSEKEAMEAIEGYKNRYTEVD